MRHLPFHACSFVGTRRVQDCSARTTWRIRTRAHLRRRAGPAPGSGAVGALAGHGSHTEGHRVAPGSGSARPVRATNQARGLLPDPHHTHSWSWSCRGAHVMASAADPSSSLGWQQHWQVEAWSPTKGTGAYMSERTESRRIWKATML
jgi:hypothetical protein